MSVDLVIKNGKVVTPEGVFDGGIAVDNGLIVSVSKESTLPKADRTIDAKGNLIMPGFIDPHTHQGLFFPFEDELRGQSYYAAIGGVTTFVGIDKCTRMGPPFKKYSLPEDLVSYKEVFPKAMDIVNKNSYVDFAFTFAILNDQHAREIPEYVRDLGVTTFKYYMQHSGVATEKTTDPRFSFTWASRLGIPGVGIDEATLYVSLESVAKVGAGAVLEIHAENRKMSKVFRERVMKTGRNDLAAVADACPPEVEAYDIARAAYLASILGSHLYVVHISSKMGLDTIRTFRRLGARITTEVCEPWLGVTKHDDPPGIRGKITPPFQDYVDREALWEGLKDGTIQCLATDNNSGATDYSQRISEEVVREGVTRGELPEDALPKPNEPPNIWKMGSAFSVIESFVPFMMTEGVSKRGLSLEKLVEVGCRNNAKAMSMHPQKGELFPGSDADIVIVNPKITKKIEPIPLLEDPNEFGFSYFEGREFSGWPTYAIVRGNIILEEGEVVGKPGMGKYIQRFPLKNL